MNAHIERAATALFITGALVSAAYAGQAVATAVTDSVTVDAVDYPRCAVEDCSDQPGQIGVWIDPDTGSAWLSLGETSVRVSESHGVAAADGATPGVAR